MKNVISDLESWINYLRDHFRHFFIFCHLDSQKRHQSWPKMAKMGSWWKWVIENRVYLDSHYRYGESDFRFRKLIKLSNMRMSSIFSYFQVFSPKNDVKDGPKCQKWNFDNIVVSYMVGKLMGRWIQIL